MLSPDVQVALMSSADAQVADTVDAFQRSAVDLASRFNSKGALVSSGHFLALDEKAAELFEEGSRQVYESFIEAHGAARSADTAGRIAHLTTLLSETLDRLEDGLRSARDSQVSRLSRSAPSALALKGLSTSAGRVRAKLEAKLRFAVMSQQQSDQSMPDRAGVPSTINFNGPVGVVQTAPGANAEVKQIFVVPTAEDALAALAVIEGKLREHPEVKRQGEALDLVKDLQAEAEKPAPNRVKVSSLLGGLAAFVSAVADGDQAWQTVQGWASALRDWVG